MAIIFDGTLGITSPGGDTSNTSHTTPIVKSSANLIFQTSGSTEAMRIDTAQNVGIGTTATTSKLAVLGGLEVQNNPSATGRLILRAKPGNSFRWNLDNDGGSNSLRVFRENDSDASSGVVYATIDTSGRFSLPYQPSFRAIKNNSQTMSSDATNVKVEYNNVVQNTGNCYNATNDRFTAPVNGSYYLSAFFMYQNIPTDYQYAFIRFLRNGSDDLESEVMLPRPSGGLFASALVTMVVYLQANDYVEVFARQAGGSSNMTIRDGFGVYSGILLG